MQPKVDATKRFSSMDIDGRTLVCIYTSVLPSISIDADRFVASTFGCIGRSFGMFYHRLLALAAVLDCISVLVMALLASSSLFPRRFGGLETSFCEAVEGSGDLETAF